MNDTVTTEFLGKALADNTLLIIVMFYMLFFLILIVWVALDKKQRRDSDSYESHLKEGGYKILTVYSMKTKLTQIRLNKIDFKSKLKENSIVTRKGNVFYYHNIPEGVIYSCEA